MHAFSRIGGSKENKLLHMEMGSKQRSKKWENKSQEDLKMCCVQQPKLFTDQKAENPISTTQMDSGCV